MARLRRLCPPDVPQHVIQRGNNRQPCFASEEDFAVYATWLGDYSAEFAVDIHAWVFMTNHVHLLVTPREAGGVSRMMQALGRRYVRFFNRKYGRSGTLWEGRFRSCLVQAAAYLFHCQRYIELNPVRANMVAAPGDYRWSSYQAHGLGKAVEMHTPHDLYLALGNDTRERLEAYRELFVAHVDRELLSKIRQATRMGLALGSERFKDDIEALCGRRVRPGVMGRPRRRLR